MSGGRALTPIGGMPPTALRANDKGMAKRYGFVLAGSGAGNGIDACTRAPGAGGLAGVGNHLARGGCNEYYD